MGFQTIGEIARTSVGALEEALGQAGRDLWELASGRDDRPVEPEQEAKSIGAEHTFAEDTAIARFCGEHSFSLRIGSGTVCEATNSWPAG